MISVVLAHRRGRAALAEVAPGLAEEVAAAGGELLVVAPAGAAVSPPAIHLPAPEDALVPELWGRGLERARGDVVALASTDCPPTPGWVGAAAATAAGRPDAAAVGGPVDPPEGGGGTDWALWLTRFSAFAAMPEGPARDLPGENVAYRRPAVERAWADREDGFWEAFVHRRLAETGATLWSAPAMRVRAGLGHRLAEAARERSRHGRHYGAHRPLGGPLESWARVAATPLLVPLLAVRIARRSGAGGPAAGPARFVRTLPWTIVILAAWSIGEARGYLDQRKRIRAPTKVTPGRGA